MSIKIILADDHKIIRDGLRSLLDKQFDTEVVGEADNGRTTVRLARELKPDLVIMDIAMPGMNGMEATRQIVAAMPATRVIALSMHVDRNFVIGMLNAGAVGYLLKDCAFEELTNALRTVVDGKIYLSPGITGIVVKEYLQLLETPKADDAGALTAREREVLQLIAEGTSTRHLASRLHVSTKTVETHRRRIMEKLDIHTIAGLTKYAVRNGLTSLE